MSAPTASENRRAPFRALHSPSSPALYRTNPSRRPLDSTATCEYAEKPPQRQVLAQSRHGRHGGVPLAARPSVTDVVRHGVVSIWPLPGGTMLQSLHGFVTFGCREVGEAITTTCSIQVAVQLRGASQSMVKCARSWGNDRQTRCSALRSLTDPGDHATLSNCRPQLSSCSQGHHTFSAG